MHVTRWIVIAFVGGLVVAAQAFGQGLPGTPEDRDLIGARLAGRERPELPAPIAEGFEPLGRLRPFPVVTDAPFISARQVADEVTDTEFVLGIVINGEARAYPLNMLTFPQREVINDMVGGQPIAATWCNLCNNVVVFDRRAAGRTLTLGASGLLWRRNLVMYDVETESLWAQFNGTAMQGELIGTELTMLPSQLTTWADWSAEYPNTTVLNMSRTVTAYRTGVYEDTERFAFGWYFPGLGSHHIRLDSLEETPVRNVVTGSRAVLVSFDPPTNRVVLASRRLDDRTLTFERRPDGRLRDVETGSIWSAVTLKALSGPLEGRQLEQLIGMFAFLEAWTDFHPNSQEIE